MNLSLFIAKRYFFSKSKASFISLISRISMISVGVEVMALILILSVFNGLEDFQKGLFKTFDPDLRILSAEHQRLQLNDSQVASIRAVPGIAYINPVLEDQGLIRFDQKQLVVRFKGVDSSFLAANRLKRQVVEGEYFIGDSTQAFALVGIGVFLNMGMSFENTVEPIQAWYPDHDRLRRFAISENTIRSQTFFPSAVLEVEQNFDNQTVIVPLAWMESLVGSPGSRSAYEIMLAENVDDIQVKARLSEILGKDYTVQTRDEQHELLLKAIKIEKLFVFLIMAFVMGIASFTLFYSLSLLVIEKRKDLRSLMAMGITPNQLLKSFLFLGLIISFSGAIVGMLFGFALAWAQQQFGIVPLGIPNALIDAYPIQLHAMDFVWTAVAVIIITFIASIFPARKAVQMTFEIK
ncbi:ABC transporter permease [Aquirufa sp. TARAVU-A1A]